MSARRRALTPAEKLTEIVDLMKAHGLRRVVIDGIEVERDDFLLVPPATGETPVGVDRQDVTPTRRRSLPQGLANYASEDLWPDGEYPDFQENQTARADERRGEPMT